MIVKTPADFHPIFVDAFNRGDADALVDLYEPDAVFMAPSGPVKGHDAIREAIEGFLALRPTIEMRTVCLTEGAGDLAYLQGAWTLTGAGPEGSAVVMNGMSNEVARRQADGNWLYVVDNPGAA